MTRRQPISSRQDHQLNAAASKKRISGDEERVDARLNQCSKGRIDVALTTSFLNVHL